ncbi:hypothetical protein H7Y63_01645 [Polaromonas sp.]|nr:hypothetical protein [Candidatus Saccharibacteria bacterium]
MTTAARIEQSPPCLPDGIETMPPVTMIPRPRDGGSSYIGNIAESQPAPDIDLPHYPVEVIRQTQHRPTVENSSGIFLSQSVRFTDGAVRLVTIGLPHDPVSDYPIISTDAWFTGPTGFNRFELEQAVAAGFPVIWNHHQGRHAVKPNSPERIHTVTKSLSSKSLSKSAAQDHALLDHMDGSYDFSTDQVIRKGYSRGAMSGEVFIAQCEFPENNRQVVWSDLEGACFARRVGYVAFSKGFLKQLPGEIKTLAEISRDMSKNAFTNKAGEAKPTLDDFLGTFDPHVMNVAHELAWLRLLIGGEAGQYAHAIPRNAKGIRTIYEGDYSGQQADWQTLHAVRPGLKILVEPGAHLAGATNRMITKKQARLRKMAKYLVDNDGDITHLSAKDVLATSA